MQNVSTRARFVANIFDIVAWVVLVVGAIAAVVVFFGSLDDSVGGAFLLTVFVLAYTAVTWAGVSLASVIAGYIEQKS